MNSYEKDRDYTQPHTMDSYEKDRDYTQPHTPDNMDNAQLQEAYSADTSETDTVSLDGDRLSLQSSTVYGSTPSKSGYEDTTTTRDELSPVLDTSLSAVTAPNSSTPLPISTCISGPSSPQTGSGPTSLHTHSPQTGSGSTPLSHRSRTSQGQEPAAPSQSDSMTEHPFSKTEPHSSTTKPSSSTTELPSSVTEPCYSMTRPTSSTTEPSSSESLSGIRHHDRPFYTPVPGPSRGPVGQHPTNITLSDRVPQEGHVSLAHPQEGHVSLAHPQARPQKQGIPWKVNGKLEAMDFQKKWYSARIVEIDDTDNTVLIHFDGWNQRYDEWLDMNSERLRPLVRSSGRKERVAKHTRAAAKLEHKLGDNVFAKWTDCRMYAGTIVAINPNGSYDVLFYDGFKKTVQPINVKAMSMQVQKEYAVAGILPDPQKRPKQKVQMMEKEFPSEPNSDTEQSTQSDVVEYGSKMADIVPAMDISSSGETLKTSPCTNTQVRPKTGPATTTQRPPKSFKDSLRQEIHPNRKDFRPLSASRPSPIKRSKLMIAGAFQVKRLKAHSGNAVFRGRNGQKELRRNENRSRRDRERERKRKQALQSSERRQRASPSDPRRNHGNRYSPKLSRQTQRPRSRTKKARSTGYALVKPEEAVPKKVFTVEEEHNKFKCPSAGCNKSFRKRSLVDYHVKYYHTEEGKAMQAPLAKKRRKTLSVCSSDSEVSFSSRSSKVMSSSKRTHDNVSTTLGLESTADVSRVSVSEEVAIQDLSEVETQTTTTEDPEPREPLLAEESMDMSDVIMDCLSKDELVNCICQINEENGLMIQCDVCLCWQHAVCMELTEETLPSKYICYVCANPPGVRDSARFSYDQDWLRLGTMAQFSFLPPDPFQSQKAQIMQATHSLVSDVLNIKDVLRSTDCQLQVAKDKNHPEVKFWVKKWDKIREEKKQKSVEILKKEDTEHNPNPTWGIAQGQTGSQGHTGSQSQIVSQGGTAEGFSDVKLEVKTEEISEEPSCQAPSTDLYTDTDCQNKNNQSPSEREHQEPMPTPTQTENNTPIIDISNNEKSPSSECEKQSIPDRNENNAPPSSAAQPTSSAAPPTSSAAPPTSSAAPPTTSTAPPTSSAALPTSSAVPPTTSAAPPTSSVALPTSSAAPSTSSTTPPTTSAAPPTTSAAPPTTSAVPPTSSAAPSTSSHTQESNLDSSLPVASTSRNSETPVPSCLPTHPSSSSLSSLKSTGSEAEPATVTTNDPPTTLQTPQCDREAFPSTSSAVATIKQEPTKGTSHHTEPVETPVDCQQNLLEHVSLLHDNVEMNLDLIEEQILALECADDTSSTHSTPDILRDVPRVKKTLYQILNDLVKVKRMSLYH